MSTLDQPHYWQKLKLDQLLFLQDWLTDDQHHDEQIFVLAHQSVELWFRQLLVEMEKAIERMTALQFEAAIAILDRMTRIVALIEPQFRVLETMQPQSFHRFRVHLGKSSGLESYQFREIEILGGLGDSAYFEYLAQTFPQDLMQRFHTRQNQTSLNAAWLRALEHFDLQEPIQCYIQSDRFPLVHRLAEQLIAFDGAFVLLRFVHIQLVERVIGYAVMGSGGTARHYLEQTLKMRFFPDLWNMRNILTEQTSDGASSSSGSHVKIGEVLPEF